MPRVRVVPVLCLLTMALASSACVTRPADPVHAFRYFDFETSLEIFADAHAALRAAEEALAAEGLTLLEGEHPAEVRMAAAPDTRPAGPTFEVRVTSEGPRLSIVVAGHEERARTDPTVIEQAQVIARAERIRDGIRRRLERSP